MVNTNSPGYNHIADSLLYSIVKLSANFNPHSTVNKKNEQRNGLKEEIPGGGGGGIKSEVSVPLTT